MEDYSVLLFYTRLKGLQLGKAIPDVQLKFIFWKGLKLVLREEFEKDKVELKQYTTLNEFKKQLFELNHV